MNNMQMQNALGQIVNTLASILQNPQGFMQQFLAAMNSPAMAQQMHFGPLQNIISNPQISQPAATPAAMNPATVNPITGLANTADAASMSVQYSNMEAARDQSAAQNWDQAVNSMGDAWDNFWSGNGPVTDKLSDAFGFAADAAGDQYKAWDYNGKAHEFADLAGAQFTMAGQSASMLVNPATAKFVANAAGNMGISGQNITQQLNDYNDKLDAQQTTWLGRTI